MIISLELCVLRNGSLNKVSMALESHLSLRLKILIKFKSIKAQVETKCTSILTNIVWVLVVIIKKEDFHYTWEMTYTEVVVVEQDVTTMKF